MSLHELKILTTVSTPEIILKPNGVLRIKGRSVIANANGYFMLIEEWLDKYICNPADNTYVDFHLEYISTSNLKIYIDFIKKIESVKLKNKKYIINWYYDEGDEDILEMGEYISSILNIPFNYIYITDPTLRD